MLNRKSVLFSILFLLVAGLFVKSYIVNAKKVEEKPQYCVCFTDEKAAKAVKSDKEASFKVVVPKDKKTLIVKEEKKMESELLEKAKEEKTPKEAVVLMQTDKGDIKIKLYMKEAPITAGNFKDLVERKFYNGLTFHRLIPGFVVQGGCPNGNGTGNFVDPETGKPRYIKHEMPNHLRHNKKGIVAMARTSDPDSASSQFFIDLAPLPSLDPGGVDPYGYAIFGEVIDGMDVVEKIVKENVPPHAGSDGSSNPVKIKSAKVL